MDHNNYTIFSDESHTTAARYRSIAAISLPSVHKEEFSNDIFQRLKESDINEFKWKKLDSAKYRFAAIRIIDTFIEWISKDIRIDVLIWDTQDRRHRIQNRDDSRNFGRMYFHLLNFVMRKRGYNTTWSIYPDEHVEIDWQALQSCLESVGQWVNVFRSPLFNIIDINENFTIRDFQQCQSHDNPICQACDLFAGISVYSCNAYKKYEDWKENNSNQGKLFSLEIKNTPARLSRSDSERLPCLDHLVSTCKIKKLGVSLNKKKRLWTPKPSKPINFWHYTPQHEADRAPTKHES